jgi:hypothetical protein
VLGYCEKGLDCDKQHVRECPDFAEKGECLIKGCRLPHVIRANRNRQTASSTTESTSARAAAVGANDLTNALPAPDHPPPRLLAEDYKLGDEYISLTFHESGESEDESGDESEDGDDDSSDSNYSEDAPLEATG